MTVPNAETKSSRACRTCYVSRTMWMAAKVEADLEAGGGVTEAEEAGGRVTEAEAAEAGGGDGTRESIQKAALTWIQRAQAALTRIYSV